ncbi:hypothetical protein BGZ47_011628 [Haplosporangium gracile]|nr:hypothetical protein BGZ47_011628 [Haplosporangium gracile]
MHFDFSDRDSAIASFKALLQSSRIPLKRRQVLNDEFDKFRKHHEEQFWTTRALKLNSKTSAQRLACVAQDTAVDEASAAYGNIPVPSLLSAEDNTGAGLEVAAVGENVHDMKRGFYDDERFNQPGNTIDAYDDDIGPDNERDAQNSNAEQSPRTKKRKSSTQKWTLESGTVVEDILLEAGKQMKDFHPIHSFMLDLRDKITWQLFSKEDWIEICDNLPDGSPYSKEASGYLDEFERVETLKDLQDLLDKHPRHIESQLKERWAEDNVRKRKEKNGVRADLVWRTVTSPETDWAMAGAAEVWCLQGNKYISESKFKLPRQLLDVLIDQTMEVGGANELRDAMVSGLIIGGPCLQRIGLCWGAASDNVTRIIKMDATRLDARVGHLSISLLAIHELHCFGTSTIQLISLYKLAARRHAKQRKRDRYRSLAGAL